MQRNCQIEVSDISLPKTLKKYQGLIHKYKIVGDSTVWKATL